MNYCSEEGVKDLRELLGMSREEKPKAEKPAAHRSGNQKKPTHKNESADKHGRSGKPNAKGSPKKDSRGKVSSKRSRKK